jgi:hypothetical protein
MMEGLRRREEAQWSHSTPQAGLPTVLNTATFVAGVARKVNAN